ncbi:MAG: carboxypeptidase regulatory-like domain-containing protein [Terriglobia bacterium]
MRNAILKCLAGTLFATLVLLSPVWGQIVTGSITGQVTDPSGAAVPGAKISAQNTATSVKTVAQTNGSGVYAIRFLPSGNYTMTVTANGFSTENIAAFSVEIAQTVKIDVALKIASVTRSVEVTASAHPILNTTNATLGNTLSTTEIANIPLNGRNFSSLTIFEPGAVATDPTGMTGNNAIERNTYNNGIASIDGNRQQANDYVLEGADDNEPQNNLIGYNPAPDAIAEVRVISSNGNATYGNTNGGTVVTVLKSGGNKYHGSAYGFLENYRLDANTWGNDLNGSPKSHYTQTIFGGTFGGPVKHNKLFFFGDYEGVRRNFAQPDSAASVLTPAMLKGDFSALNALGIQLYDPLNNDAPYPNNQVPVVNPVAKYLAAHPNDYPAPNRPPEATTAIGNNYVGPQSSYVRNNQEDFKVDWTPTLNDRFSGFYSQGTGSDFTSAIIPVFFPSHSSYPTKIAGASFVHTFSPALVNEFRAGFTRVRWNNGVPSDPSGLFGLNGDSIVGIPFGGQSYVGFSGQSISDASYVGTNANPQVFTDNTFVYSDDLTWQRGRHLLTMGGQAIRYQQNFLNAGNVGFLGTFSYSGSFSANLNATNGPGYGPADFILDRVSNRQLASPLGNVGQRQWRLAGYFQDDFKVSPKLTLNLGIRYEFDQPWYETGNRTANVLPGGTVEYAGHVPAGAVPGSIVCPTRACYNANYRQFMPRVGFAYQMSPKFVVRGGYAGTSFFEGYSFNQRLTSSPPFTLAINQPAVLPSSTSGGVPFTVEEGFGGAFGANPNYNLYSIWPQDTRPAYIHEYNLTAEYAFTNELSLSVGYVGQNGFDLADYYNGNQLTLAQAQAVSTLGCGATFPAVDQSPYYALVGECGTTLVTESDARMNYNAAQVTLRERTHDGLDFSANYTYAKSLTDSSGNYTVSGTSWNGSTFENAYDKMADWGPSAMDIRHSLNLIAVYDLPFGRGRTFGSGASGFLDAAFGGWRLSASALVYSGFPITIFGPDNSNSLSVFGFSRANQYRPLKIVNRTINNWWGTDPSAQSCRTAGVDNGTCAYGEAGSFTFGDAANSTERGPGYHQLDTSLFKNFQIRENQVLSFRADFFNVFNAPSYGNPDGSATDSSFGLINGVRSPPRQIQFSLDYHF